MTTYGFSFGLGGGLSRISLTDVNTSLATRPLKDEESGLAFTVAPGIGMNLRGLIF